LKILRIKQGDAPMATTSRDEPTTVEVVGRPLHCYVCGYDRFWQRSAQLNTALATFFNFDWINSSATCCICAQCGHIHWFLPQPEGARAAEGAL
jgi:hypothetical protein